jgi:hypothetical protein
MRKTCTSEFFKDDQNCTRPKEECNVSHEINDIHKKIICSHMRAYIGHMRNSFNNFNINNFNRKSTKNASHFCHCKCLVILYYFVD